MDKYYSFEGAYVKVNYTKEDKIEAIQNYISCDEGERKHMYLVLFDTVNRAFRFANEMKIEYCVYTCDEDKFVILEVKAIERYREEEINNKEDKEND